MAKSETWGKVKEFFKPDSKIDRWGDPDGIQDEHLLRLYDFRAWLGVPVFVTSGVRTGGHKAGSYHNSKKDLQGKEVGLCATDVVIPDYDWSPYDLVLDATRFGFRGIGYYPHWSFNGVTVGGLHLDSRPLRWDKDLTINYAHSLWLGVLDEQGFTKYIALTFDNMLAYSAYSDSSGLRGRTH